jgi:hypothetical protein
MIYSLAYAQDWTVVPKGPRGEKRRPEADKIATSLPDRAEVISTGWLLPTGLPSSRARDGNSP